MRSGRRARTEGGGDGDRALVNMRLMGADLEEIMLVCERGVNSCRWRL
jgi:hypothetical protein